MPRFCIAPHLGQRGQHKSHSAKRVLVNPPYPFTTPIAGIAYSRRDAFDIAPAGFAFFPDEIVELTPTPAPVPLTQLLARIKAFSISKSLTNFHSETLEG